MARDYHVPPWVIEADCPGEWFELWRVRRIEEGKIAAERARKAKNRR